MEVVEEAVVNELDVLFADELGSVVVLLLVLVLVLLLVVLLVVLVVSMGVGEDMG